MEFQSSFQSPLIRFITVFIIPETVSNAFLTMVFINSQAVLTTPDITGQTTSNILLIAFKTTDIYSRITSKDNLTTCLIVSHTFSVTLVINSPCSSQNSETLPRIFSTIDRKSTRLNSSHVAISYAVFCLKQKT